MTFKPFAPRPTAFDGVLTHAPYRLKLWRIHLPDQPFEAARFEPGLTMALDALPRALRPGDPGLGFLIRHQGDGADYVILGRWARENELPILVWRDLDDGWRPAGPDEFVCVWDLDVVWRERNAYVAAMLSGRSDPEAYLAA